jgi:hypothetical protein
VDLIHADCNFSARGYILIPGESKRLKISVNNVEEFNIDETEIYTLNNYL